MRINWSKFLFFNFRRRRKSYVIGHDVFFRCRLNGKFVLVDGLCVSLQNKKQTGLTSSITIKNLKDTVFFLNVPVFLTGTFSIKVTGLTYGFNVNCSKLVERRLKK